MSDCGSPGRIRTYGLSVNRSDRAVAIPYIVLLVIVKY